MKRIFALLLILILTLGLFGCAKSPAESIPESVVESSTPEPEPEPITVAVCMGSINHPVHRIVQTGFLLKAEELGMKGVISGLDQGSIQELIATWESAVDNGAKGVLVWTGDDSCYDMMKSMKEKGAYTVVPHFVHSYIDTKNFIDKNMSSLVTSYSVEVAKYILDKLAEKGITEGDIGITVSFDSGADHHFKQTILESGTNFNVLDSKYESWSLDEATTQITNYINDNPNMVAAYGTTGASPRSWAAAMEATGRTDLIVVGLDFVEENMTLVENGTISAIVCQPLFEEGEACAQTLFDLYNGSVFNISEDTWFEELEAPIADKDDISHYRGIYRKMYDYFGE